MPLSRRQLVLGGSGVALSGLALATALRRPRASGPPARSAPPPPGGSLCSSPTAPARASAAPRRPPLHVYALAKFVDPLPVLSRLSPGEPRADPDDAGARIVSYQVSMRETEVRVHRDLPPAKMWGYGGSVPGPVIETRTGEPFLVEWANDLPRAHFLPIDHTLHGAG
ncbi:MAG: bilirubin oxidase, partial [Polyangiaceae bacterium]